MAQDEKLTVLYACLAQGSDRNVVMQVYGSTGTCKLPQIELAVIDGCTDALVHAICISTGVKDMYNDRCVIRISGKVGENDEMVPLVIIDENNEIN